jgi:hypothetical protein
MHIVRAYCKTLIAQTVEELEMHAMELARQHVEDEVAAFEREGEVAQAAMVRVLEDTSAVAVDVAVGKMHVCAARKAVETVATKAVVTALRAMCNDLAMVSLEAVAMEAAKVAVCELCDGVIARQASAEAQIYDNNAADEESHIAATAMVAARTTAWLLVDGDETEVEDDDDEETEDYDDNEETEAEAQRDVELCAAAERVKAAAPEEEAVVEAAEQAAHWAAEMDKALAYRRDVDWNAAARRDGARCVETERLAGRRADFDHLIEWRMTVHHQEGAIRVAMAAIEAVDFDGNGDGGTLQ